MVNPIVRIYARNYVQRSDSETAFVAKLLKYFQETLLKYFQETLLRNFQKFKNPK